MKRAASELRISIRKDKFMTIEGGKAKIAEQVLMEGEADIEVDIGDRGSAD